VIEAGFTVLGLSPSISADGMIAVFYGELNAAGVVAQPTTSGSGIFARLGSGEQRNKKPV
jgi:hypothetical protein